MRQVLAANKLSALSGMAAGALFGCGMTVTLIHIQSIGPNLSVKEKEMQNLRHQVRMAHVSYHNVKYLMALLWLASNGIGRS